MLGDPLPPDNHFVRYCQPKYFPNGRPAPGAFEVTESNSELSGNWAEYFGGTVHDSLPSIRTALQGKLTIKRKGGLAAVNVGSCVESIFLAAKFDIRFEHQPDSDPDDPSHSLVLGIPLPQAQLVAELLVEQVIEYFPALEA